MNNLRVFNFKESDVRVLDFEGELWFVAKDLCQILEIKNDRDAMDRLRDYEKSSVAITDGTSGNPNTTIVSESGMYRLVMTSRKPQAQAFQDWVVQEVLPSIRKTGKYRNEQKPKSAVELFEHALDCVKEHEQRLKELEETQKKQEKYLETVGELAAANSCDLARFKNGYDG